MQARLQRRWTVIAPALGTRLLLVEQSFLSKQEALNRCWFDAGPALGRRLVFACNFDPALNHRWRTSKVSRFYRNWVSVGSSYRHDTTLTQTMLILFMIMIGYIVLMILHCKEHTTRKVNAGACFRHQMYKYNKFAKAGTIAIICKVITLSTVEQLL